MTSDPAKSPDRERPSIEHHRPVEYHVADHGLQQEGFTVTPGADGQRIHVAGICPGCGGRVSFSWEYGVPGYKGRFRRKSKSPDKPTGARTICCDCGYLHTDRPAESWDQGCGAHWQVELP